MKTTLLICTASLLMTLFGCASRSGLVVTHTPNPTALHDVKIPEGRPFPYMWFYRTEVRNATEYPIRITGFEGYFYRDEKWVAVNVFNRALTADDFSEWFTQGAPVKKGWIMPGATAVCDPNWHGVDTPVSPRCKWTFDGVDSMGKAYHVEAEIESVPVGGK